MVTRALASPVQPGICTTRLQRGSSIRLRAWMARGLRQKMGMPPPSDAKSTRVPKGYPARLQRDIYTQLGFGIVSLAHLASSTPK